MKRATKRNMKRTCGILLAAWLVLAQSSCTRSNLDALDRARSPDGGSSGPDGAGLVTTCPSPALLAGNTTQTVQVGTTSRNYLLHVPQKYDGTRPAPLILDFHAQAATGASELAGSPYPAQTDPEGVVMAFPSGLRGPAGTAWNVGPCCVADVDDVAFARSLVAQVKAMACIDAKRVYAVGVATGGGMAN